MILFHYLLAYTFTKSKFINNTTIQMFLNSRQTVPRFLRCTHIPVVGHALWMPGSTCLRILNYSPPRRPDKPGQACVIYAPKHNVAFIHLGYLRTKHWLRRCAEQDRRRLSCQDRPHTSKSTCVHSLAQHASRAQRSQKTGLDTEAGPLQGNTA